MDEPTEMMRRLAADADAPVESDAPEDADAIPYDPGLQQELIEYGGEALREYGVICVRKVADRARYNSAVWYALAQEPPLRYELRDGCVWITDPGAT